MMTASDVQMLIIQGIPTLLPLGRKLSPDEADGLAAGLAEILAATVLGVCGASDEAIDDPGLYRRMAAAAIRAMEQEWRAWVARN